MAPTPPVPLRGGMAGRGRHARAVADPAWVRSPVAGSDGGRWWPGVPGGRLALRPRRDPAHRRLDRAATEGRGMTTHRLRRAPTPFDPDRRLRVLFLIDSLGHGGAEHLLASYLDRLPAHGVDPVVVALQERDGNPLASVIVDTGVAVRTLGINRLRERSAYRRVAAVVAETAPDVVHTQLEFSNILGTVAAARLGIPTITTLHTLDRPAPWSRDAARFRLMAWVLRRRADRVIAVSRSARDHFLGRAHLDRDRVVTIFNGIDTS